MPLKALKTMAKERNISAEEAENKWNEAKKLANKETDSKNLKKNSINYYRYTMSIFKKLIGL